MSPSEPPPGKTNDVFWKPLLCAVGILTLLAFLVSVHDLRTYSAWDLRIRIASARLLMAHYNPYTAEHQDDPRFKMRMWRKTGPGAAYPPTYFLASAPLSQLPFPVVRDMWFGLEWAAMLACVTLLWKFLPPIAPRRFFLVCGLLFFVCSDFWRMHVARGQFYCFILLLEVVAWIILRKNSNASWLFGIPLGLAAAIRPTVGVAGLVLLVLAQWRAAIVFFLTVLVFMAATLPFGGMEIWRSWVVAARDSTYGFASKDYLDAHYGREEMAPFTVEGATYPGPGPQIRTLDFTFGAYAVPLVRKLAPRYAARTVQGATRQGQIAFAVALTLYLVGAWRFRARLQSPRAMMLAILWLASLADLFAPIRFSYADVLFLLPLALLIEEMAWVPSMWLALAPIIVGLLLGMGHWSWLTDAQCENLRPTLIMAGIALALALYCLTRNPGAEIEPRPIAANI